MKQIAIKFQDDVQLNFMLDDKHEFLLTTKEVALGYGVNSEAIRQTKRRHLDELIENKHFISVTKCNGNPRAGIPHNETYWTKRGIIRLGFFIKIILSFSVRIAESRDVFFKEKSSRIC